MSVLRSIEAKLESLFEGVFGRAFRSNVQPVELARKLVKEMDDHRSVSVSRVYVPNEYTVYLAPSDRRQFDGYEDSLCEELQDYLAEHARRERYVLLTAPQVRLETDADLAMGEFGIATRLVRGPREPDGVPARGPVGATMVYAAREPVVTEAPPTDEALAEEPVVAEPVVEDEPRELALLSFGGEQYALPAHAVVIGRSKDCDIRLTDPNVSRRHAEIRPDGDGYVVVDLDSTNGIEVDGRRVKELTLADGDRFTLGTTEVSFSQTAD
jgi:hypothetical protein